LSREKLAKVVRIELTSQGFGDLRITIFPDQRIVSFITAETTYSAIWPKYWSMKYPYA
jgi:hypothetical protein